MNTAITSLYCFPARGENVSDLFFFSCSWDMISMPTLQVGGTAIIAFVIADGNTKTLMDTGALPIPHASCLPGECC